MNRATASEGTGFLDAPAPSAGMQHLIDGNVERLGFAMNLSSLWGHHPALYERLSTLIDDAGAAASLTLHQRAVLITSCASALGDSYCSLTWGRRLAREAGADVAAGVLRGADDGLGPAEQALARWARKMTRQPSSTEAKDLQPLRDAGYDDAQIFAISVFVALRLAFAFVNDALGAQPDAELLTIVPAAVRDAITFGRPVVRDRHGASRSVVSTDVSSARYREPRPGRNSVVPAPRQMRSNA
jgi:alkylhydroperoxidase family enzyme